MDIVRKIFTGWQVTNNVNMGKTAVPNKQLPIFRSIALNRMGSIDSGVEYEIERYQVDLYKKLNKTLRITGEDYISASMLENANYDVGSDEVGGEK